MLAFDGRAVARKRRDLGMRPEHVAVAIGRSAASVRLYERGLVDPPASVVAQLAYVLGVDAGDLFADQPGVA